jgi:DNA-3-methyladenine glycosylase
VVTGPPGRASAVLIRALEPLAGLAAMARRRGLADPLRLARGPGCVARALGLDTAHDGTDLTHGPLWLADRPAARSGFRIARSPRIGISRAVTRRWRFYLAGHPCVSGPGGRRRPGRGGAGR